MRKCTKFCIFRPWEIILTGWQLLPERINSAQKVLFRGKQRSALYFRAHISPKTVNSQMRENTESHSDQNTHKTHSDQNTQKMHSDQNTNNLILIKTHKCTVSKIMSTEKRMPNNIIVRRDSYVSCTKHNRLGYTKHNSKSSFWDHPALPVSLISEFQVASTELASLFKF